MEQSFHKLFLDWYGTPLSIQSAEQLARQAATRLKKQGKLGATSFTAIMMQMVADWWLVGNHNLFPERGMHYADSRRKQALYHLIAGQLLMSCKLQPAMDYLDMGLRLADGLIHPDNYFSLYNRHEELRFLHLANSRQKPRKLTELLNESRVMRKLTPNSQYSIPRKQH